MILLTGFYQEASAERAGEFVECLRRNSANESIEQICLVIEDDTPADRLRARGAPFFDPKVRLVSHGRRLTYAALFDIANREYAGHVVIVANADIFFDETLAQLEGESLAGTMLCLSRCEDDGQGRLQLYEAPNSQDAWIFETPLPPIAAAFELGMPGCDNRIAHEAACAGLKVLNPSRSIRAVHLHASRVRNYTEQHRLRGPYKFVAPSFLGPAGEGARTHWPPESQYASHRGRQLEAAVRARARPVERQLREHLGGPLPRALRSALRAALAERMAPLPLPAALPLAGVGFRETMGYRVVRMTAGESTHVNDPRPIASFPPALEGLQFTQVVANDASPVDLEFLTSGRLFALSGRGWYGYAIATAFLDDAGWRNASDTVVTRNGTVFDVWTLAGRQGETVTLPTQVMLATHELVKMA